MKSHARLLLVTVTVLLGCTSSTTPLEDAGPGGADLGATRDATSSAIDGGQASTDTGPVSPPDSGPMSTLDEGVPASPDSGTPAPDASTPTPDAGPLADAGPRGDSGLPTGSPGYTPGAPLTGMTNRWTWVDFPSARCMNGSPTGIGVSLNPASTRVLIYFQGGGACFDFVTCLTAAGGNGYGASNFGNGPGGALFDRNDAANPFRDWNMVYVPYCTGDVFAGNNPVRNSRLSNRIFTGYTNVGEFMNRIVPTFPTATQVVLTGESAGGFGAAYNYDRTQQAFGNVPVHLMDDSGPPMSTMYMKTCLQENWRRTWNLDATFPTDCTACRQPGGISQMMPFVINKYPNRRFGLISSTSDGVIRTFFGYGYSASCTDMGTMPASDYLAGLVELRDTTLAGRPNFRTWYINSATHTWLTRSPGSYTAPGTPAVPLRAWEQAFVDGTAAWVNVGP